MATVKKEAFAEIMESSLQSFTGQCWEWDVIPAFGSLVGTTVGAQTLIGVVTSIETKTDDPVRYPFAYKKTEEELRRDHPHIFEFLKTTFSVTIMGYHEGTTDTIYYVTPPKPAPIHGFIAHPSPPLIHAFFARPDYLYVLCASKPESYNLDELLLCVLHNLHRRQLLDNTTLEAHMHTFAGLMRTDYQRTKLFLYRLQQILHKG